MICNNDHTPLPLPPARPCQRYLNVVLGLLAHEQSNSSAAPNWRDEQEILEYIYIHIYSIEAELRLNRSTTVP